MARSFHVFNADYPGHAKTSTPSDYPMTASQIGSDLGDFTGRQIGEPVFVTGNSSGGLLATWLAANRPGLAQAALVEDPPLFSAEYPRIQQTIGDGPSPPASERRLRTIRKTSSCTGSMATRHFSERTLVRVLPSFLLTQSRLPVMPVEIGLLPNTTIRMMLRGLDEYDPRFFGAAFDDGSWNRGFDHAEALGAISCPVPLIQANFSFPPDGILNGAMSKEEAERATSLLKHGKYLKVDASRVVNLDRPGEFVRILRSFFPGL